MRGFLTGEDPGLARFRAVMRHLPHGPNCKLCAAPFEGPGGAVLRHTSVRTRADFDSRDESTR